MVKFNIGELVKIKNGPMADEVCVITGYAGKSNFLDEPRYYLRFYGGGVVTGTFRENNLERYI